MGSMDLLKAEIERKRKAKQDEFSGQKYVKRSQVTAVREGKLREAENQEYIKKHGKPKQTDEEVAAAAAKLKTLQGDAGGVDDDEDVRCVPSGAARTGRHSVSRLVWLLPWKP